MSFEDQCKVFGCGGKIDKSNPITLRVGCDSFSSDFYPCSECGRIHSSDGFPTNNRPGDPVFLVDGYTSLLHQQCIQVWRFESEEDLMEHKCEKAELLGELSTHEQLHFFEDDDCFLGYYDPKSERWITYSKMWALLK